MTNDHTPAGAGPATPENDEARGQAGFIREHKTADGKQYADDDDASQLAEALRKKRDTLAARLALRGFELRQTADGAWLITRWNMARHATDLDAAEHFARQVGA